MRRMYSEKELQKISQDGAKEVIESGLVENAKPIYCHPITMILSLDPNPTENFAISFIIFNNDPTPFTFSTFIKWAEDLSDAIQGNVSLFASGFFNTNFGEITSISNILCVYADKSWRIRGGKYDSANLGNINLSKVAFAGLNPYQFSDDVNKLN